MIMQSTKMWNLITKKTSNIEIIMAVQARHSELYDIELIRNWAPPNGFLFFSVWVLIAVVV